MSPSAVVCRKIPAYKVDPIALPTGFYNSIARNNLANQHVDERGGGQKKFESKKIGPFRIIQKTNDNTYVLDFPDYIKIFKTFNMADLFQYYHADRQLEVEFFTSVRE
ncbi:hypothetical protein MANES_03G212875v8 [Manihot esculenta]|uniref:Uncharacterized protein n=1 Tax=Manihot esculenta TaxID=3983 RepID=A0ACB7I3I1_MANES|nr:hypothetical protein MANES_03G212875v8 [Manihot esculenta]